MTARPVSDIIRDREHAPARDHPAPARAAAHQQPRVRRRAAPGGRAGQPPRPGTLRGARGLAVGLPAAGRRRAPGAGPRARRTEIVEVRPHGGAEAPAPAAPAAHRPRAVVPVRRRPRAPPRPGPGGGGGAAAAGAERNRAYALKPQQHAAYRMTRGMVDLIIANSRAGA